MSLFPLTPKGVEDKLNEIYALGTPLIALEAAAIENNFKRWLSDNFSLTAAQDSFLLGINSSAARYYGQQCAICFQNRLDISLNHLEPPNTPDCVKWPISNNTIQIGVNSNGQIKATGALIFTITYC